MSGVWTDEMDKLLLHRKDVLNLPWRSIVPIEGMGKTRCQGRYDFLKSGQPRPEVKVGASEPTVGERDGLKWLRGKKRISHQQLRVGNAYRTAFRDGGDLSMKSQLCAIGGIGSRRRGGYEHQTAVVSQTAAKRALFVMRFHVLRGQLDMLTVMDGVCGLGLTLRYLAGGNAVRARELEMVLKIALDLILAYEKAMTDERLTKVSEHVDQKPSS